MASILAFQLGRFLERQNIPPQSTEADLSTPTSTPTPPSNDPAQRGPSLSQVAAMQVRLQTAEAQLTEITFQFEVFGAQAVYTNLEVAALQGTGTAVSTILTRQTDTLHASQATIAALEGNPFTPTPTPTINGAATLLHKLIPPTPGN
ncbi:MAG: hypothetical protein AAF614_05180 [Chloroflexota bacterium]